MNKVEKVLKMQQFKDRILVMWISTDGKFVCVRDRLTGKTKTIEVK
jgi:hypothetical protein